MRCRRNPGSPPLVCVRRRQDASRGLRGGPLGPAERPPGVPAAPARVQCFSPSPGGSQRWNRAAAERATRREPVVIPGLSEGGGQRLTPAAGPAEDREALRVPSGGVASGRRMAALVPAPELAAAPLSGARLARAAKRRGSLALESLEPPPRSPRGRPPSSRSAPRTCPLDPERGLRPAPHTPGIRAADPEALPIVRSGRRTGRLRQRRPRRARRPPAIGVSCFRWTGARPGLGQPARRPLTICRLTPEARARAATTHALATALASERPWPITTMPPTPNSSAPPYSE